MSNVQRLRDLRTRLEKAAETGQDTVFVIHDILTYLIEQEELVDSLNTLSEEEREELATMLTDPTSDNFHSVLDSGISSHDVATYHGQPINEPMPETRPIKESDTIRDISKSMGFTGNECKNCQSMRMQRAGTCEVCQDCGTTTGCS